MSRDQSTTKALALGEKQQHLLPTLTESVVDGALRLWHDNLRSARTQENYGRTIGRFRQYLRDLGHDLDGDRRAVALAAEKFARAKQRADGTIVASTVGPSGFNARLAALSSFFNYAIIHELLPSPNPIDRIQRDTIQPYADVSPQTFPAIKKHLAQIDRDTLEGGRDYALLSVALVTGRRRAELVGIRWSSLTFLDDGLIKITWKVKGGKTEHDELPRLVSGALLRFLHDYYDRELASIAPDAAVWPSLSQNRRGRPISGQALADICEKRLFFSKVHTIRHTFAKELEDRGLHVSEIQARLGHASLQTTAVYLTRLKAGKNPVGDAMAMDLGIEV